MLNKSHRSVVSTCVLIFMPYFKKTKEKNYKRQLKKNTCFFFRKKKKKNMIRKNFFFFGITGWEQYSPKFILETVEVMEVLAIVRYFAAHEHLVMVENLVKTEEAVFVGIGRGEEMLHLASGSLSDTA